MWLNCYGFAGVIPNDLFYKLVNTDIVNGDVLEGMGDFRIIHLF